MADQGDVSSLTMTISAALTDGRRADLDVGHEIDRASTSRPATFFSMRRRRNQMRRERTRLEEERRRLERARQSGGQPPPKSGPPWSDVLKGLVQKITARNAAYVVILAIGGQVLVGQLPAVLKPYLEARSDALPVFALPFVGFAFFLTLAALVLIEMRRKP